MIPYTKFDMAINLKLTLSMGDISKVIAVPLKTQVNIDDYDCQLAGVVVGVEKEPVKLAFSQKA